jgi:hypothetical protein
MIFAAILLMLSSNTLQLHTILDYSSTAIFQIEKPKYTDIFKGKILESEGKIYEQGIAS